jgi:hypothetical protein
MYSLGLKFELCDCYHDSENSMFCIVFVYSPCWEVATCQGGFEKILGDQLDAMGHLHLIFSSIKYLMQ